MKTITRHIPNAITSLNLLSGCVSIVFALSGNITWACYLIFIAAVFDFFDGFAARLLKAYSPIGLQLDSLADVVSFGVAPAAILLGTSMYYNPIDGGVIDIIHLFFPFVITIFSALRLAKFNIDTRQSESFIGLPTPACALLIASGTIAAYKYADSLLSLTLWSWRMPVLHMFVVVVATIILSALLVSEIPMFSLKVKKQENMAVFVKKYAVQLTFLLVSLVLVIVFGFGGIALAILTYIIVSIINWMATPKKAKGDAV